jgi:hypothetical protein
MSLPRHPPIDVIREIRAEVGFSCPVEKCGNPYLTWHHFDPPWRVEQHHRAEGLVALCLEHANKADGEAFTADQIRELKRKGAERAASIEGRFDWRRRELLAVVGGNFYAQTNVILQIGNEPCIWFSRDNEDYQLLNFKMPTATGQQRAEVLENFWTVPPDLADLECPPSGRKLRVRYPNGDELRVEFFDLDSAKSLTTRYPDAGSDRWADSIEFPITGVEISEKAPGTPIEFGPRVTRLPGILMQNSFVMNCGVALQIA